MQNSIVTAGLGLALLAGACAHRARGAAPGPFAPPARAEQAPGPSAPGASASAPSAAQPGDADLEQLLRAAQERSPGLQAAFHRWQAADARAERAGALPNPRLTLAGYLSEIETRTGPLQARVGLQQPLPWFGTLGTSSDRAEAQAEAARAELEITRLALAHEVRSAWVELAWLERAIAVTRGHLELLAHWEAVSRTRLETGLGTHSDVVRAQVELGDLENRLRSLQDQRRPLAARVNAALDRPTTAELPVPALDDADARGTPVDEATLLAGLAETSPELRARRLHAVAAEHGVELARKAFYPDLLVGAEYTFIGSRDGVAGSGDDAVALTLGLDLPLWVSSNRAGLRGARAERDAAERELRQAHNDLAARLEHALFRLRDAERRATLYRESLIPKGEEAVEALASAYRTGDRGFLDLVDAERGLLEFQLQAARARADRALAVSEIERIAGVKVQ